MKRVLIDTNIYSLAMKGEKSVTEKLKQIDRIGFSVISIGELLSGFKGGSREEKNRRELDLFLDSPRVRVFPIDAETCDFYAALLNNLKKNGTPIPTNDIWIAATSFQTGFRLFSKDQHFSRIPGLVKFGSS